MINKIKLSFFIILFSLSGMVAQTDTLLVAPAVFGKGKVINNKIALKWNVNDPYFWKIAISTGYKVQRTTVLRDGLPINKDETVILKEALKPLPLDDWKPLVAQDSLVLVIAQAIYGEEFTATKKEKGVAGMMMMNDENQQRYAFSLMAAEQSYIATKAAGWGLEDETAKPNEKYVYTITLLGLKTPIQPATIYIGLDERNDKTPPLTPDVIFGNQNAMLIWDFKSQQSLFSSYILERSTDGKIFKSVTDAVIYPMENKTNYMTYTDKLAENGVKTYYRLTGIDAFGAKSEPSKVVFGMGLEFLEFSPQITAKAALDDETVNLEWDFPTEGESKITGFNILQAPAENGPFIVSKKDVSPSTRKLVFKAKLLPSNYFKVQAIAKTGGTKESYAMLVQPIDSIPPSIPNGIEGKIDSLGVVKLKWKKNTEPDFYGYKVFRSYKENDNYVQVTTNIWANNIYQDSINAKALNRKIYYKLKSVDLRYNESDFSKAFTLVKVDKIAPSKPVLSNYELGENLVVLNYLPSASEDVAVHKIYRRQEKEKDWKVVFETKNKEINIFEDKNVIGNNTYYYSITATDEAGNETEPTEALVLDPLHTLTKPAINSFSAVVNRDDRNIDLFWSTKAKDIIEYQLYKRVGDGGNVLYKIIPPAQKNGFTDTNLKPGNTYYYSVRALFKDGTMSTFKEAIAVY